MHKWYFNIPPGEYTVRELMELAQPKQKYRCVKSQLVRFKVESYRRDKLDVPYNPRNEKIWKWLGAEYYLNNAAQDIEIKNKEID